MKVRDLIELLQNINMPNAEVKAFDADSEKFEPVTGICSNSRETVELCTDDNS